MRGMTFKKAFLLGGIFLLATLVSIQLSWSCDDDDKWNYDCHDKWHCDQHGKPCQPPKIQRVFLEYEANSIIFDIRGQDFDKGATPVVSLGGIYDLTVVEPVTENQIVAELFPIPQGFKDGDHRLVVSTCQDSRCRDCMDYCSKCKGKHCRDYCSKCRDRYCRNKYCRDDEHKCKCKDRYALTIANPQGQAGPPGISGYEKNIIRGQITLLLGGNTVEVPCSTANKKLLGGGGGITSVVPSPNNPIFQTIYNGPKPEPRADGKEAWVITWNFPYEYEKKVDIAIYAICADALDQNQRE